MTQTPSPISNFIRKLIIVLILGLVVVAALYAWNPLDRRKLNPHQPISIEEMLYSGTVYVLKSQDNALSSSKQISSGNPSLHKLMEILHLEKESRAYIYKGIGTTSKEKHVILSYHYPHGSAQVTETLNIPIASHQAVFVVPAIKNVPFSRPKKILIQVDEDAGKIRAR